MGVGNADIVYLCETRVAVVSVQKRCAFDDCNNSKGHNGGTARFVFVNFINFSLCPKNARGPDNPICIESAMPEEDEEA